MVIVCLNNAEVEVDSGDHEDIDRNEKEESQTLAIFPQRSRAHEAPGTPAKAYKGRVTNQGLRTISGVRRTGSEEPGKWMHYANAVACRRLSN